MDLKRIFIAFLVGVVTGIVIYVIGAGIELFPPISVIGIFLKSVAVLLGIAAAIWFYVSGKSAL